MKEIKSTTDALVTLFFSGLCAALVFFCGGVLAGIAAIGYRLVTR